ncbi:hypothetical protein GGI12_003589 [Dipsacomyces acuminosporus]|nr:hypothetical protein GGI12_003589 [Dipsacomyces acuminosporus]
MSRTFTVKSLMQYNGTDEKKPILLGFNGKVYDVTASRGFYGPGGNYSVFAGRDCTRNLCIGSLRPEDLPSENDDLVTREALDEMLWHPLDTWQKRFTNKYPVVGILVGDWYI